MQKGETLYDVSQAEGIRLESLLELNHLKGDKQPAVGEKLYLQVAAPEMPVLAGKHTNNLIKSSTYLVQKQTGPYDNNVAYNQAGGSTPDRHGQFTTHKVSSKETLFSISRKYGVSMDNLKEWNRLNNLDVKVGQELIIY
jgi:LysM repeat protein